LLQYRVGKIVLQQNASLLKQKIEAQPVELRESATKEKLEITPEV
jgi:hypothetical protein